MQPGYPYEQPAQPAWQQTGPQVQQTGYLAAQSPARQLRIGDLLAVIGGFFVFAFSFAPFVSYSDRTVQQAQSSKDGFSGWYMAWSTQMFMAPLTWWVILSALLLLALAVLRMATGRESSLIGFKDSQLQVGLGLFAVLVLIGYALSHKQILFGLDDSRFNASVDTPSFGWGGILMLISALVALTGAILNHFNVGPSVAARLPQAAPPGQPAGYQPGYPQTGAYPQPGAYPQTGAYPPVTGYPQAPGYSPPTGGFTAPTTPEQPQ